MNNFFKPLFAVIALITFTNAFAAKNIQPIFPTSSILKVQLLGAPQVQFAGFYLAQTRNFFENQGLDVTLIPGNPEINSIKELQEGRTDIALSWMSNAQALNSKDAQIVNIAQIFDESSLRLVCKISSGIYQAADLKNKTIGLEGIGDQKFIQSLLKKNGLSINEITQINGVDQNFLSIGSKQDCITTTSYGGYLNIIKKDSATNNIIEFIPEKTGVPNIEDGIYVLSKRLEDPEFKKALVHFLIALRQGWLEARKSPAFAIEAILQQNPKLSRTDQYYMLEQVLELIPEDPNKFGLLDIGKFNQQSEMDDAIWTHKVWNQMNSVESGTSIITYATSYYMKQVTSNHYYKLLVYLGVFIFALSGILEAIDRSYDMYGRIFLGFLSGLGGGTIRDLLIQGDRFPFYYVKDVTYPLGILTIAILMTFVTALYPNCHKSNAFKNTKKFADIFGFSVLAITGAVISLSSGLPWFWAPLCAALSCSGGGVLRDVIVNQEPSAFKKTIYEEPAIIGALAMIVGLYISNQYEHSSAPVVSCILASILLIIAMKIAVYKLDLQYPKWLGGQNETKN